MEPHVFVMTGAGVSADSGVATFRDAGGLWEGHRPEDVATPDAWARDRAFVWRFYQARRARLGEVEPNAAHVALHRLEQRLGEMGVPLTFVTQNVDDLHERAGSDVLHMHGELAVLRCERCDARVRDLEHVAPDVFVSCEACGHDALRPDVVWFGEVPYHVERLLTEAFETSHFLAVGTSGQVWPAAGFLESARSAGATTWVQSLDPPVNLHPRDLFRRGRAAEVVPALVEEILAALG